MQRGITAATSSPCAAQATSELVQQYAQGVENVSGLPPSRRGCAAALGVLPCQLLAPCADQVLRALATGIKVRLAHVDCSCQCGLALPFAFLIARDTASLFLALPMYDLVLCLCLISGAGCGMWLR